MATGEAALEIVDPEPEVVEIDALGEAIDEVVLEIDYAIVRHFSEHLYGSPNKAVEELVANSFDAMASRVRVYVPGQYTDHPLVWDDGDSMDVAGLQAMWKIARSDRDQPIGKDRVASPEPRPSRQSDPPRSRACPSESRRGGCCRTVQTDPAFFQDIDQSGSCIFVSIDRASHAWLARMSRFEREGPTQRVAAHGTSCRR